MTNREVFSTRLRELRTAVPGLSMQALAEIVGLKNKGSIGQFESGIGLPSVEVLVALADYFKVSIDYMVGRTDNPEIRKIGITKQRQAGKMDLSLVSSEELIKELKKRVTK